MTPPRRQPLPDRAWRAALQAYDINDQNDQRSLQVAPQEPTGGLLSFKSFMSSPRAASVDPIEAAHRALAGAVEAVARRWDALPPDRRPDLDPARNPRLSGIRERFRERTERPDGQDPLACAEDGSMSPSAAPGPDLAGGLA